MEIKLRHETKQIMGQQMQMSMHLLQMSTQELDAYLRELSAENPLIEELPPSQNYHPLTPRRIRQSDEERSDNDVPDEKRETLREYVRQQVLFLSVPQLMLRELLYLTNEMDERGYLPEDCAELEVFAGETERCEAAIRVFQSLEPAGVGARSLSECLTIQLRRMGCEDETAYALCDKYLVDLAKGKINKIAKELGIKTEQVIAAKEIIAKLSPTPSNGFAENDAEEYVIPDVELTRTESGFEIATSDRYLPSYRVDAFYTAMAKKPDLTDAERDYFAQKLRQASWAVRCVERRRDILMACAEAIVEAQSDFFSDGVSPIRPYTMSELAEHLGVHVSTVSRAVKGKYILCSYGVYPLTQFFKRETSIGMTADSIMTELRSLIANEDPAHPLSDRALMEALIHKGYDVSRRTIAKYRDQAGIAAASGRRKK